MDRAGSLFDIVAIVASVFMVSVAVLFGHLILTKIQDNTTDEQIDQETLADAEAALEVFDVGILFVMGALWLAAIIFAIRIPSNPIFFVPALIFLVIATWVSAEVANIFNIIVNTGPFTTTINSFGAMFTMFENFPMLTGFLGIVLIMAIYAKISGRVQVGV